MADFSQELRLQSQREGHPHLRAGSVSSANLPSPEPSKVPMVPFMNVHSIGEASPMVRQVFAIISAAITVFLRVLCYGPFFIFLCIAFPRQNESQPSAVWSSISLFTVLYLVSFVLVASVVQLLTSFILMWTVKNLLLGTVKDGIWPIWGWKMACLKGLRQFEESIFVLPIMKAMERTELPNFFWRLMGSQVGRGAFISLSDDLPIISWDLVSIGENAILDGMNICGSNHTFHIHRPLSIGNGSAPWQRKSMLQGDSL